jgi:hypothetical protein
VGIDALGPERARSVPGRELVAADEVNAPPPAVLPSEGAKPARRATQESDYGRRGKGDLFGAFTLADGEALTVP